MSSTTFAPVPAVVADVYFVDFPANPAYAFVISAAPVVQYTVPIGPAPEPAGERVTETLCGETVVWNTCRCCGSDVPVAFPVDYCGWCRGGM